MMFLHKNRKPDQIEFTRQIITFVLVQGAIFSTLLFVNHLTGISYSLLLAVAGIVIFMLLIPSNLELNSYVKSAPNMTGHNHQDAMRQILQSQLGWRESLERFSIGLIPFAVGIILTIF